MIFKLSFGVLVVASWNFIVLFKYLVISIFKFLAFNKLEQFVRAPPDGTDCCETV